MSELLMLAKTYDPNKSWIAGWWVSTKMDGMRAFWDGGISRGYDRVPWQNPNCKLKPTGLWSRYGACIQAPDWWLDSLPHIPLDGELWSGPKSFNSIMSIVKRHKPDDRWKEIKYHCFDSPDYYSVFEERTINSPNLKLHIDRAACMQIVDSHLGELDTLPSGNLHNVYKQLKGIDAFNTVCALVGQYQLSSNHEMAKVSLEGLHSAAVEVDAEGLIVRNPNSYWGPTRSSQMLKVKATHDAEATVTGFTEGKGKYEGMVGALVMQMPSGVSFELSGMSDAQRVKGYFKVGDNITYKYAELTPDGVPRHARFYRVRVD